MRWLQLWAPIVLGRCDLGREHQWLFLVSVTGGIGGRWYIIPQLAVYTTYIPLIVLTFWGGYIATYHLLGEPETTIENNLCLGWSWGWEWYCWWFRNPIPNAPKGCITNLVNSSGFLNNQPYVFLLHLKLGSYWAFVVCFGGSVLCVGLRKDPLMKHTIDWTCETSKFIKLFDQWLFLVPLKSGS